MTFRSKLKSFVGWALPTIPFIHPPLTPSPQYPCPLTSTPFDTAHGKPASPILAIKPVLHKPPKILTGRALHQAVVGHGGGGRRDVCNVPD